MSRRAYYAVGAAFSLLFVAWFTTRPAPPPLSVPPKPVASPLVPAGRVGGLLPDIVLSGRVQPSRARDLRPGVVVLVAPSCDCLAAVRQVVAAASRHGLVTYLVESGTSVGEVATLAVRAGGQVGPYADPGGALARAYGLHTTAALVLVRDDGVVTQVIDAVAPSLRLDQALERLVTP